MFDPDSRYAGLEVALLDEAQEDGSIRQVRYVRRRFLPPLGDATEVAQHSVQAGDRLDSVTARYLGDPKQFYRLCDTNPVRDPNELTSELGRVIRIFMTLR